MTNELPLLDQYSDPKDLIDTFKNTFQVEPYGNEEDQNYMVPFSESQEQQQQQSTTTVLHDKRKDSLSERLESGFNGEVYENIPTESPEHRQIEDIEVSPSHVEDSYYETTWGNYNNNNNNPANGSAVPGRSQPPDCYQNYNAQFLGQQSNDNCMYENAKVLTGNAVSGNDKRYANDNVFITDDPGSTQIPVNDSRPDAEYDVPWTSAHAAAQAAANAASNQPPMTSEQDTGRRPVLKSSNSTDEFNPQPPARRRHKSGDLGNKNLFAKITPSTTAGYQNKQPANQHQQDIHQTKTMDFRPEDDYDQPWELTSGKRNSQALRGNESGLVSSQGDMGKAQFQDPTNDLRPEDDYDQPWNLTSKQPSKGFGDASTSVELSFNANHQKQQSSVNSVNTVSTNSVNEERGFGSQLSASHAMHKSHHRSSQKVKKQVSSPQGATELVDANLSLEEQVWYHGQISRVAAEARLRPAPECSYLVRRSESTRHDYSLSIKSASNIMHMKIQYQETSRKYILGQFSKPYNSIPAMIAYYSKHTLNIKGAENVVLLRPVPDTADNML